MKKLVQVICAAHILLFSISTMAADKVVVIPLGGQKATGDAVAADVLDGKSFSNNDAVGINGSMVINGAVTITPGVENKTIPEGYHNGDSIVEGDSSLIASNIRRYRTIFGVQGNVGIFWGCRVGVAEWDETNCYNNCYTETQEHEDCISFCNTISEAFENAPAIFNSYACNRGGQ